jgi:hypothetical protein
MGPHVVGLNRIETRQSGTFVLILASCTLEEKPQAHHSTYSTSVRSTPPCIVRERASFRCSSSRVKDGPMLGVPSSGQSSQRGESSNAGIMAASSGFDGHPWN